MAVALSAMLGWIKTKFFLGRKIDRLHSQIEIDNLLWLKKVYNESSPTSKESIRSLVLQMEKYDCLFPSEVLVAGSQIVEAIDEFVVLIRMHGFKEAI